MNLKYKVRTYNFWISLASAVLLFVRLIGQRFGFEIDGNAFMDIVTALCGILVVLGIITMPVSSTSTTKQKDENLKNDCLEQTGQNAEIEAEKIENDAQNNQNSEAKTENNDFEIAAETVGVLIDDNQNLQPETELVSNEFASEPAQDLAENFDADSANLSQVDSKPVETPASVSSIEESILEISKKLSELVGEDSSQILFDALGELAKNPTELSEVVQSLLKE